MEPLIKHLETINGNVKNLSKMMEMKDKGNVTFTYHYKFHWPLEAYGKHLNH